jgi:hypothetical protein
MLHLLLHSISAAGKKQEEDKMTKDEALKALFASIDESITETLCGKRGNFLETMLRSDFHIPHNIAVHAPEKLKDSIIEHYKKNGFRAIDCGRENRDTYIYIIQIGW